MKWLLIAFIVNGADGGRHSISLGREFDSRRACGVEAARLASLPHAERALGIASVDTINYACIRKE